MPYKNKPTSPYHPNLLGPWHHLHRIVLYVVASYAIIDIIPNPME